MGKNIMYEESFRHTVVTEDLNEFGVIDHVKIFLIIEEKFMLMLDSLGINVDTYLSRGDGFSLISSDMENLYPFKLGNMLVMSLSVIVNRDGTLIVKTKIPSPDGTESVFKNLYKFVDKDKVIFVPKPLSAISKILEGHEEFRYG